MDDSFEMPSVIPKPTDEAHDDEHSSEDEDEGPDWTKLPSMSATASRPTIPKRGDKDYEPKPGGGSGLQLHVLDRARTAMFSALRVTRGVNNKSMSYAIWYPALARAHVTVAKGIHFSAMGHSVQRSSSVSQIKIQRRLELLPEETLYLIERGALWCSHATELIFDSDPMDSSDIPPMSVQQAYAHMIGTEDLTLEKYQVFAYLKRLGYVVTRAEPPSSAYPVPPPLRLEKNKAPRSLLRRVLGFWSSACLRFFHLFMRGVDWLKPLGLNHTTSYSELYKSLRFIPSGYAPSPPPSPSTFTPQPRSPYHIFYHLYKPSTPFRKTSPPNPDFYIVVVNARSTPMPCLRELEALYDQLPDMPPPLPRQRSPPAIGNPKSPSTKAPAAQTQNTKPSLPTPLTQFSSSILQRLLPFFFLPPPPSPAPERKPHPFMALKAGTRMVVIAAVDSGNISFFRFGKGAFGEWPMA